MKIEERRKDIFGQDEDNLNLEVGRSFERVFSYSDPSSRSTSRGRRR